MQIQATYRNDYSSFQISHLLVDKRERDMYANGTVTILDDSMCRLNEEKKFQKTGMSRTESNRCR